MDMVEIIGFSFLGMCFMLSVSMMVGVACYVWETIHTYRKEKNDENR